ncbi:hypothetical protein JQX13_22695 [Archangium violaceum]|uniref:hypothetical protein n=1 Tax=Archangium violaceum TaxID=83451 RepID=UPI00193C7190|nr:hypothetical protein [Archangium violaceum]QRK12587.1 hypothetical protein JQX13_22695 [Archangium violaceum]
MGQFSVEHPTPLTFEALTLANEELRPLPLLWRGHLPLHEGLHEAHALAVRVNGLPARKP